MFKGVRTVLVYLLLPGLFAAVAKSIWNSTASIEFAVAFGMALSLLIYSSTRQNPSKARTLNDDAIAILRSGRIVKRGSMEPRPPKLASAMKLFRRAASADRSWLAPSFNFACRLYYLNLIDSGNLNMGVVLEEAAATPDDPDCAHIIKIGTALAERVRIAGESWFRPFDVVDPELFLPSTPKDGKRSKRTQSPLGERTQSREDTWRTLGIESERAARRFLDRGLDEAHAAADDTFRKGYDDFFLKPHADVSDQTRRCSDISRELQLAMFYIKRNDLDYAEKILRKTVSDAEVVQDAATRSIAFRTFGDFLYQLGLRPLERVFVVELLASGLAVELPVDFDGSAIGPSVPGLGLAFQNC